MIGFIKAIIVYCNDKTSPVPQRREPGPEPAPELLAPVDDVVLVLQLPLGLAVEQLGEQLLLGDGGQIQDF